MIFYEQVLASENSILDAMKSSDVITLDKLLHEDLLFVIPDGTVITKEMDMSNWKSGTIKLTSLIRKEISIKIISDTAVSTMTLEIKGSFAGNDFEGEFRYMRVWKLFDKEWKVIAGSGIQLH